MAKILSKSGISTLQIVRPWHVTQSIDAFTGTNAYDITLSGSMIVTGSIAINGLPSTVQNYIITYNTSSGQLGFTASSAIGGGGGSTSAAGNNYEIQFNSASAFQANSTFKFNYLSQSLEQGTNVTAKGEYSHAQGLIANASGAYSHAEGGGTLAAGVFDHAEGAFTTASSVGWPFGSEAANAAHSEGYKTIAYGIAAHAEGSGSYVSASHAHAEGIGPFARGISSHAEGSHTTSSGEASHAEGFLSHASGIGSHAEGGYTLAVGNNDHAEGYQTTASSVGWPAGGGAAAAAHAEGYNTIAYGIASHAEGYATLVSASFSHAEGYGTTANGSASHAEGFLTTASGDYSHAAGYGTHATGSGVGQSVIGWFNEPVTGRGDFIIGNGTSNSSRSNLLHASGSLVTVKGNISSSGTFIGDGSSLTNLQRPITSSGLNFSASISNAGYYFRTGGNVTCSIGTTSATNIPIGSEYEFFQTASNGYLCFTTASGVTLNSKSGKTKLAGQFSGATLKKVGTDEFDLIGDLG